MLIGFQNNACIAPHLSKEKVVHKTKITSSEKKKKPYKRQFLFLYYTNGWPHNKVR
jgi:hypothetical protein